MAYTSPLFIGVLALSVIVMALLLTRALCRARAAEALHAPNRTGDGRPYGPRPHGHRDRMRPASPHRPNDRAENAPPEAGTGTGARAGTVL